MSMLRIHDNSCIGLAVFHISHTLARAFTHQLLSFVRCGDCSRVRTHVIVIIHILRVVPEDAPAEANVTFAEAEEEANQQARAERVGGWRKRAEN
jgi:predicted metal-binding protein